MDRADTPLIDARGRRTDAPDAIPLGRAGQPFDLAAAGCLARDAASGVSETSLVVDGGMLAP
jgi:NAD(P)-dependent dehydrogenase (short-subunit alcohol dehydrogenase family)